MKPREGYRYSLFGLVIESEIALPEMEGHATADPEDPAELAVRLGPAAEDDGYAFDVPDIARYSISGGRLITVTPAEGASDREIRLFLLGSAMGIALHQRGILPLHANAIDIDGSAVAFVGKSGSGKSTLAAWFLDEGFRILADDVCVVRIEGGAPFAYPGLPRLRLWQDALEASGRNADHHPLSYHLEDDVRRKYDVTFGSEKLASLPLPLRAIIFLEEGPEFSIQEIRGAEAVEAISGNTYRGEYISEVGDVPAHVAACVQLAQRVPSFRLVRPFDRAAFGETAASILSFCRSIHTRPIGSFSTEARK